MRTAKEILDAISEVTLADMNELGLTLSSAQLVWVGTKMNDKGELRVFSGTFAKESKVGELLRALQVANDKLLGAHFSSIPVDPKEHNETTKEVCADQWNRIRGTEKA